MGDGWNFDSFTLAKTLEHFKFLNMGPYGDIMCNYLTMRIGVVSN